MDFCMKNITEGYKRTNENGATEYYCPWEVEVCKIFTLGFIIFKLVV